MRRDQSTDFGWRLWEYRWTPRRAAYHTVMARARDAAGNTQPLDQEWNPSGYAWNVVPRVGVNVVTTASPTARGSSQWQRPSSRLRIQDLVPRLP